MTSDGFGASVEGAGFCATAGESSSVPLGSSRDGVEGLTDFEEATDSEEVTIFFFLT